MEKKLVTKVFIHRMEGIQVETHVIFNISVNLKSFLLV